MRAQSPIPIFKCPESPTVRLSETRFDVTETGSHAPCFALETGEATDWLGQPVCIWHRVSRPSERLGDRRTKDGPLRQLGGNQAILKSFSCSDQAYGSDCVRLVTVSSADAVPSTMARTILGER
jgi:hypothetical protein